jgi:hypothetical protein
MLIETFDKRLLSPNFGVRLSRHGGIQISAFLERRGNWTFFKGL